MADIHYELEFKIIFFVKLQIVYFNLLKTKRNLLYVRNQSVPLCKHFPLRL